jgi:hypothetical protein
MDCTQPAETDVDQFIELQHALSTGLITVVHDMPHYTVAIFTDLTTKEK